MPININPGLVEELLVRQAHEAPAPKREMSSLSPDLVSILGAAADGASTYKFLKQGAGQEGNQFLGGKNATPAAAALGAAGMGVGMMGLSKLIRKKWPGLADTLQGPLAGRQLAIGLTNLSTGPYGDKSSDQLVSEMLSRETGRR